jgi:CMP-N,N'-diacetyllegionaminic acid synthase
MRGKILWFDIDGVIFRERPGSDYTEVEPIQENIDLINEIKRRGNRVILFTARGSVTGVDWKYVTTLQLLKYGVQYDELLFGKPACDYCVDNRAVTMEALRGML